MLRPRFASFAGGREDGKRPHQPEGGRAGRLRGPVQNQETHPAEQADEGLLREAGARAGWAPLLASPGSRAPWSRQCRCARGGEVAGHVFSPVSPGCAISSCYSSLSTGLLGRRRSLQWGQCMTASLLGLAERFHFSFIL